MKVAEQTASAAEDLQADPRWQLVQRVVASPGFARSARLSSFLLFVSQRAIQGRTENLNEQEIGVKVFGRSEDYMQSDDNIVRANASRVRQRLEGYFATEGQFELLRISLPKGGYIPEFVTISLPISNEPDVAPEPMEVRYARDLQAQDFRQSNVILLGARYANPWVSLLDSDRQYALLFDEKARVFEIQDRSRPADHNDLAKFHPGEPDDLAYTLVAFVPNSTAGRHVLVLEGTTIAGTEAAVDFVLESSALDGLLARHLRPDGSIPNFELVLESRDFSGTSSAAKVIASRFWL